MKARDVIGRRIVGIEQTARTDGSVRGTIWQIDRIRLDDGRTIYFSVAEQEDGADYIVRAHIGGAR